MDHAILAAPRECARHVSGHDVSGCFRILAQKGLQAPGLEIRSEPFAGTVAYSGTKRNCACARFVLAKAGATAEGGVERSRSGGGVDSDPDGVFRKVPPLDRLLSWALAETAGKSPPVLRATSVSRDGEDRRRGGSGSRADRGCRGDRCRGGGRPSWSRGRRGRVEDEGRGVLAGGRAGCDVYLKSARGLIRQRRCGAPCGIGDPLNPLLGALRGAEAALGDSAARARRA